MCDGRQDRGPQRQTVVGLPREALNGGSVDQKLQLSHPSSPLTRMQTQGVGIMAQWIKSPSETPVPPYLPANVPGRQPKLAQVPTHPECLAPRLGLAQPWMFAGTWGSEPADER